MLYYFKAREPTFVNFKSNFNFILNVLEKLCISFKLCLSAIHRYIYYRRGMCGIAWSQ
jgi:hypothetical protein